MLALVPVLAGAVFNGIGVALDDEDVVRGMIFGAAGGAIASAILLGLALIAVHLLGVDLSSLGL